jgi:DNA polymerase
VPKTPPREAAAPRRTAATLEAARADAAGCRRCDLWKRATQTVFGFGPPRAPIVFVGEQPGDVEDREGEPFVGPAGTLLRGCLADAGLDPAGVYLTNAVKHFKWREQGKRRIHERPNRDEILACRFWLEQEIAAIRPRLVVALGSTAASALVGSSVRVLRDRGTVVQSPLAGPVLITVHPSSILRAPDSTERQRARQAFVDDLRAIARHSPN